MQPRASECSSHLSRADGLTLSMSLPAGSCDVCRQVRPQRSGTGSGFVIDKRRIITNAHGACFGRHSDLCAFRKVGIQHASACIGLHALQMLVDLISNHSRGSAAP